VRDEEPLISALRERLARGAATLPASPMEIALTESKLGFRLPPLLRQIYGVANGGLGPGFGLLRIGEGADTLAAVYRSFADSSIAPKPSEPGFDQYPWPDRLLPICDWGCAIWSCLDCGTDGGAIVTASNGHAFANAGHTLESWLLAWLAGVDLSEDMFEPGPTRAGINPFTKQPIVIKVHGKPRGARWP
jgi:hypothetical protein